MWFSSEDGKRARIQVEVQLVGLDRPSEHLYLRQIEVRGAKPEGLEAVPAPGHREEEEREHGALASDSLSSSAFQVPLPSFKGRGRRARA